MYMLNFYSLGQCVKYHLFWEHDWGGVLPPAIHEPKPVPDPSSHQPHSGSSRQSTQVL